MQSPVPALGWGHINVNVENLDRSIAFYAKLGFKLFMPTIPYLDLSSSETAEMPADCAQALGLPASVRGRACILELDGGFPKLDLTELQITGRRAPLSNADVGVVRMCLISQDLAADCARLVEQGVRFVSGPTACHARLADVAVCQDPDGTLIELLQIHMERWQALG
ncbi:MAG: VOC family protein [Myxococcales bacterium]|nr:VOC family protein [Myxococcales bacterium]MDD9965389.1 VOC family protein [Myxococcales bacterium]